VAKITYHFSLFCVVWLVADSHHFVTDKDSYSGFPLFLLLTDFPFTAVFTLSGNLFQHSTDLTVKEYFHGSIPGILDSQAMYSSGLPCPGSVLYVEEWLSSSAGLSDEFVHQGHVLVLSSLNSKPGLSLLNPSHWKLCWKPDFG
jgi:hypothetical protein